MKNYGRVHDLDELKKFAAKLIEGDRPVGFDIETGYEGEDRKKASLHPEESIVVGFSFSNDARWARYAPLAHDAADNLDPHEAAEVWWPVLQQCKVVAHNAKFELRCMALWFLEHLSDHPVLGEEVRAKRGWFPIFSDTMIESYVDGREKTHGLKDVTLGIFGHEMMHIQELFKDMKIKMDCLRFNILPLSEEVIAYACEDAAWCLAIHELLYPGVKDQRVYQIDMKLIPILTEMEEVGLVYDWPAMRKSAAELTGFLERLNAEILQDLSVQCGEQITINLGSAPQVGEVLYKKLKMPVIRKTPKGAPSTDEKAITGLSKQFPVVRRILDWRELTVLQTRYLIGFEKQYGFADDGRVHASHAQTTVAGGRFAVSEPNYQQSANRYYQELRDGDSYECKFRQFLIVPKGTYMFGFDYSQIELRMTAGVSREPAMLESFRTDIDVHAATAGAMFGISPDKVTKEQRQAGKQFNFALLYGQGVKATAEILGISHAEAQDLYDRYFAGFPTLKVWTQRAVDVGRQQGYVTNIFGRKIVIWDYESRENWIMAKGDRLCVNAQIQGSAADYMRIAMIRVDAFLTEKGLRDKVKLVMNIHDALEFYVAEDIDPVWLANEMRPVVSFPLPNFPEMRADFHHGPSWGELEEITPDAAPSPEIPVATAPEPVAEAVKQCYCTSPSWDSARMCVCGGYVPGNHIVFSKSPSIGVLGIPKSTKPDDEISTPYNESLPQMVQRMVETDSFTVVVEVADLPFEDEFEKFISYLKSKPGNNSVLLKLTNGELLADLGMSAIDPSSQAAVSMILGSARVKYDRSNADTSGVLSGLSL